MQKIDQENQPEYNMGEICLNEVVQAYADWVSLEGDNSAEMVKVKKEKFIILKSAFSNARKNGVSKIDLEQYQI